MEEADIFIIKAEESLDGAESEFVNGRYNNCANRCYYSCFQGAVAALLREGIHPRGAQGLSHAFVQAEFVRQLIHQRKRYPGELRSILSDNLIVRQRADYEARPVSEVQASRALRRTRTFVEAIRARGGETA